MRNPEFETQNTNESPFAPRPLRLILCLSWYQPIASGAERQAQRQARELVRRGHAVTVLTRRVPGEPSRECVDGVEICRQIRPWELGPGFGLTFVLTLARQLYRRRRQADLIHCHQAMWEAVASGWIARRTGIPTLVQPAAGGPYGEVQLLQQTKGQRLLRRLILQNTHFVAISAQIADELQQWGVDPARLDRIASGVDIEQFAPGASMLEARLPPRPRVVFLGRLHPQKNLPVLLQAWAHVARVCPTASLLLAGDGPQREALRQQVAECRLEGSAHLLGPVTQPEQLLRAADVFVLPSISEGMSNSLLEAMASGCAPVVSDAGGNTDLVTHEHTGLVADASQAATLAAALNRLLTDHELRSRCAAASRLHVVQHYSIQAVVDRYEALYRRLIAATAAA